MSWSWGPWGLAWGWQVWQLVELCQNHAERKLLVQVRPRRLQGQHKWLSCPTECWCWCLAAALASAGCCTAGMKLQSKGKRNDSCVKATVPKTYSVVPLRFWGTEIDSSAAPLSYPKTDAENFSNLILCKCSPFSGFLHLSFSILSVFTPERQEMGEKTLTSVNGCTKGLIWTSSASCSIHFMALNHRRTRDAESFVQVAHKARPPEVFTVV